MRDPGHDLWRRRLDALNEGRPQEPYASALPRPNRVVGPDASPRTRFFQGLLFTAVAFLIISVLLAAFPLARERSADPCSAMQNLINRQLISKGRRTGINNPEPIRLPNAELPDWIQCYVIYWRRLEIPSIDKEILLRRDFQSMDLSLGLVLASAGATLALITFAVWRRRQRGIGDSKADSFNALGIDAGKAAQRVAAPPVDLSRPIVGDAAWEAIRAHAADAAYRRAVETVRLRYQLVGNQMLLPNTIKEVMGRAGLSFREAMLRIAEDDGLGHPR